MLLPRLVLYGRKLDTAYLWENAEVAQAYMEAWQESQLQAESYREVGLGVLEATSQHHYGHGISHRRCRLE